MKTREIARRGEKLGRRERVGQGEAKVKESRQESSGGERKA